MRKNIRLFVIAVITLMLAMTGIVEARKGETSSNASSSKSSTSSKPSKTTVSKNSESSRSSKTNSSFADAAKTRQAKVAWQERVKKNEETQKTNVLDKTTTAATSVIAPQNDTLNLERQLADLRNQLKNEKKRKKADKISTQLAALEKQIADARRQQQMIAVTQTAAQIAINNRTNPRNPVVNTTNTKPVNAVVEKPVTSDSGGISWFTIFLIIGVIVVVILWLRKGSSSSTIYRL